MSDRKSIKLIGSLAIEKGWITEQQLAQAISIQEKEDQFIGNIFLQNKWISQQQLEYLLELQKEEKIREEEFFFGAIAVHNHWIKATDVVEALDIQKEMKFRKSIGEIFEENKLLTSQQCQAILKTQKRIQKTRVISKDKKVSCPKCKFVYKVNDAERYRKVRCKSCQYVFEIGEKEVQWELNTIANEEAKEPSSKSFLVENNQSFISFLKDNDLTPNTNLDSSQSFAEGDNRYVVGREIARGGMGAILSTRDINLRRNIVTKVLLKNNSKLATLRFIEEAQITGQLEHPNIPPVYDLGVNKEGNLYFTMKHIKGQTLESIIKELKQTQDFDKYPLTQMIEIFIKICNALSLAHSKKVIHRDIKPENIMVGEHGEVLLMDWGLAKIIGTKEEYEELSNSDSVSSVRSEDESTNTLEGTTAGTPAFMAPEQAQGYLDELDERADVYSLGATLFNLLVLERPIKGKNVQEILLHAAEGKIGAMPEELPQELKAITLKAMQYEAADRYQSIYEFQDDLLNYQRGYSVSAKDDSALDLIKKFYRRNQVVSLISITFLSIILIGSIFFGLVLKNQTNNAIKEKLVAQEALKKLKDEQDQRQKENRLSAPSYFARAQSEIETNQLKEALISAQRAVEFAPNQTEYLSTLTILQLYHQKFKEGLDTSQKALESQPNNEVLIKLHQTAKLLLSTKNLNKYKSDLTNICQELKLFHLAQNFEQDLKKKLELWQLKLEEKWGKNSFNLGMSKDAKIIYRNRQNFQIPDLSPLIGLEINEIAMTYSPISNLDFAANMPIESIYLYNAKKLNNISGLKSQKLFSLYISDTEVSDISILKKQSLRELSLIQSPIKDLSPLKNLRIEKLTISSCPIEDYSVISTLKQLKHLSIGNYRAQDLNFLKGLKLETINLTYTSINDLSALEGMPLVSVNLGYYSGKDISFLFKSPVEVLEIRSCKDLDYHQLNKLKKLKTLIMEPKTAPSNWVTIINHLPIKEMGISNSDRSIMTKDAFMAKYKP